MIGFPDKETSTQKPRRLRLVGESVLTSAAERPLERSPTDHSDPELAMNLPRLVIVGGGMVCRHFCKALVDLGLHHSHAIEVFGEEAAIPYDRVHLSRVFEGGTEQSLELASRDWYERHGIALHPGEAVLACDPSHRQLSTKQGKYSYDTLVFATGAAPVRPKLEGLELPGVSTYRTLEDAQRIRELARATEGSELPAVVLGAGLLGIEVASCLKQLGCSVELIEASSHLLPRQLNEEMGQSLERRLRQAGFRLHKSMRISAIERRADGLRVHSADGSTVKARLLVVATGVRPRDEVARDAGIACDLFGGIEVDERLQTSVPGVYAIGECVRFRGNAFGLVAPGYQMADVLARRLSGLEVTFEEVPSATRLKISEVELTVFGESNVKDLATTHCVHEQEHGAQTLVLRDQRLVGAAVLGAYSELTQLQQAVAKHQKMKARQLRRFERGEALWPRSDVSIHAWPDAATVCTCLGVSCGALRRARAEGASSPDELQQATGASSMCGSCLPLVQSLCGESSAAPRIQSPALLVAAILALLLGAYAAVGPSFDYSTSVQERTWDELWRSPVLKQVSGFSLLGVALAGMTISIRKRWGGLLRLDYSWLRNLHAYCGVACLVLLGVHTGFRLGANLDQVLAIVFVSVLLLGGGAALVTALEQRWAIVRSWQLQRRWTRLHLWVTWPLPVLVLAHVLKVYFF